MHLFYNTKYIIVNGLLKIRRGFLYAKDLDVIKIESISKTNTIISAPAASFYKIELKYGQFSSVVISPKDKIDFIEDLLKINPNIDNQIK